VIARVPEPAGSARQKDTVWKKVMEPRRFLCTDLPGRIPASLVGDYRGYTPGPKPTHF